MSSSPTNFWYTNPPYGIDGEWQGSGMVEFQLSSVILLHRREHQNH